MLALYLQGEIATTIQRKNLSSSTKESGKAEESCDKFHLQFAKS